MGRPMNPDIEHTNILIDVDIKKDVMSEIDKHNKSCYRGNKMGFSVLIERLLIEWLEQREKQ